MRIIQHSQEHPEGIYLDVPDIVEETEPEAPSEPSIEERLEVVEEALAELAEVVSND